MSTSLGWEVLSYVRGGYPLGIQTIYPALLLSVGTLLVVTLLSGEPAVETDYAQPRL